MSMPLSSGSDSSSRLMPARPPPNRVAKVCWKLALIAVNASRKRACVVSSMRLMASLVWAIESMQILPLRGQEAVARLELRVLLDGHHVHRPDPVDLPAELGDGLLGGHVLRDRGLGALDLRHPPPRPALRPPPRGWRARRAPPRPPPPCERLPPATSSSDAPTASSACCARCARSDSAVARVTSRLGGQGANRIERAPRVANHAFLRVDGGAEFGRPLVRDTHLVAQRLERSDVGVEVLLVLGDAGQQPLALVAHQGDVPERRTRRGAPAPRPRRPSGSLRRPRRRSARPASACAARASAAVWLAASACSRADDRRCSVAASASSAVRLSASSRTIDSPRLGLAGVEARDFLANAAHLGGHEIGPLLHAELVLCRARHLRLERDDGLFLAVNLGRERLDRGRGVRDRLLELGGLLGQGRQRGALGRRCARAAP